MCTTSGNDMIMVVMAAISVSGDWTFRGLSTQRAQTIVWLLSHYWVSCLTFKEQEHSHEREDDYSHFYYHQADYKDNLTCLRAQSDKPNCCTSTKSPQETAATCCTDRLHQSCRCISHNVKLLSFLACTVMLHIHIICYGSSAHNKSKGGLNDVCLMLFAKCMRKSS